MGRHPIFIFFVRWIIALAMLFFVAMTYWSNTLIEKKLKKINADIQQSYAQLHTLQRAQALVEKKLEHYEEIQKGAASVEVNHSSEALPAAANNTSFSRWLETDLFYASVLPQLLGPGFQPKGTRRIAVVGAWNNVHPFNSMQSVCELYSKCSLGLGRRHVGQYDLFAPEMAMKIEEKSNKEEELEFWVYLRPNVFWQPLKQAWFSKDVQLAEHFMRPYEVVAEDFKFYFDAVQNPYNQMSKAVALRESFKDIKELEVVDPHTFIVRWKQKKIRRADGSFAFKTPYLAKQLTLNLKPLPRFVYQYYSDGTKIIEEKTDPNIYRTHSVWADTFSHHWAKNVIVSCGPWMLDQITEKKWILKRNPDFYDPYRALNEQLEIVFKDTPDAVWQSFKQGQIDTCSIRPNDLVDLELFEESEEYQKQIEKGKAICKIEYEDPSYYYIGWNERHPLFASDRIRQALSMAIDQKRIIQQNLNGLGYPITGPFLTFSSSCDPSVESWPYDPQEAIRILEASGWIDRDGDGIRDQEIEGNKIRFRFTLNYYLKSPIAKANCEYIAMALKEIGIQCQLQGLDALDLMNKFDEKDFDAIHFGWAVGTLPENPRPIWHSLTADKKGSLNAVGFQDYLTDELLELLDYEHNEEERKKFYRQLHKRIHEKAPYTFLYSPKHVFLYREYVHNVFIPQQRQDLLPEATVFEPVSEIFWLTP